MRMGTTQDFLLGPHAVRPSRACIERDGRELHVKPKSMAVLVRLAEANGGVVTRNELFDSVWPNSDVSDDVLTHSIVELRKALGDSAREPEFIETIPKSGFRLVAPIVPCIDPAPVPYSQPSGIRGRHVLLAAAIAIVVIAAIFGLRGPAKDHRADANAALVPSVAVLPFVDMSRDQDHTYFADGLSEEMINRLTRIEGLQVTGRTSSFYFKGRNEDLRSIGETLGVGHILEGSVRKSGDRLRVTAQLVDVGTGFHVWSDTYDRSSADIFIIQDEIAEAVARALSIRLSVGDLGTLEGGTSNVAAFEAVLQGNALVLDFDATSVLRSIEHYRRAVELDPEFAIAWERLANIYRNAWLVLGRSESRHWSALADEAMSEALRLAPTSPQILTTAAYIHADRQEWPEALRILDRVAELESSRYVAATMVYSDFLTKAGRAYEAVAIKERSRIVDPLHSGTSMYLAHQYAMLGRIDDAFAELERGWSLGEYRPQLSVEGLVVALSADDEPEIRRWLERAVEYEQPGAMGIHSAMLETFGDREAQLRTLESAFRSSHSTDYYVIVWAAYLGDQVLALDAMRRSPDLWAIWLPVVADIRREPEFIDIIHTTGLPEYWQEFGWGDFCRPLEAGSDIAFECR